MASLFVFLLSLALVAVTIASPIPDDKSTTVAADEDATDVPLYEVIEIIEEVPVVPLVLDTDSTTEAKEPEHKIAKRSALRGDNPENDLLANFEGLRYDNGLSGIAGRRIKFLPTWLG